MCYVMLRPNLKVERETIQELRWETLSNTDYFSSVSEVIMQAVFVFTWGDTKHDISKEYKVIKRQISLNSGGYSSPGFALL